TSQNASLFFPVAGSPSALVTRDLNHDGHADLMVTSDQSSNAANVLLGNGDGTFQATREFAVGPGDVANAIRQPVVADLNGDGIRDLVVPNFASADISILLGRGDGTFAPERRFDATIQPDSIAMGDFDRDGTLDLAVLGRVAGSATVAILLGRGDGTFKPPQLISVPVHSGEAFPILAGILRGNGKTDLVVVDANDASFYVLL